jgi:5-methylcytosine-specific restriction endonuclease McrA
MPYDKSKYPKGWKAIALQIKQQANWTCQHCGKPCRQPGQSWENFQDFLRRCVSEAIAVDCQSKPQRYTLTVAHIDPDPMNCHSSNLLALCSVCHLRMDAKMHGENARKTRMKNKQLRLEAAGQLTFNILQERSREQKRNNR